MIRSAVSSSLPSEDGWTTVTHVADVVGLIAFALVLAGIVVSVLTRPRISVQGIAHDSLVLTTWISYSKGSRPATNVNVAFGGLDNGGVSRLGDDSVWRASSMLPGDGEWIVMSDPSFSVLKDNSGASVRFEVPQTLGIILSVTWDHPILPTARARRVILWTRAARAAGAAPQVLKGRKATAAVTRANSVR